jgi:hypothetical protein
MRGSGIPVTEAAKLSVMHLPPLTWIVDRLKAVVAPIGRYFYREREHQWEHFSNKQNHYFQALALAQIYRELTLRPSVIGRDETERRQRVRDEFAIRLQGLATVRASDGVVSAARDLRREYESKAHQVLLEQLEPTSEEHERYLTALVRFEDAVAADIDRGPR